MEWSNMLPEVVDIIAHKHINFYEDYHPFAGVCKSWHSAALHNASKHHYVNGPPSRLPSLMLAEKSEDDNDKEFRELFLLANKSIRKIRLPEAYGKVCRSSSGWLVTVGEDHAAQLVNPLSHETINLPKVDTFPQFVDNSQWHQGITKLLLLTNGTPSSSALPLVVVLWGCSSKLGVCRPGDNKWIHVRKGWGSSIYDVTYYNKRVYTFDGTCNIKACDVYGGEPMVLVNVTRLPVRLYDRKQEDLAGAYIIGLDDGERKTLLVVIRHGLYDEIEDEFWEETYKTKRFLVFGYDLGNGKWSAVEDLGKKTLFVGHNSSFWIEDMTGVIKSNSIYYTDDVDFLYRASKDGGGRDIGIYSLSEKTIEPHFTGESRSCLTPPIWIQ
ncbi:hypothetical protein CTI12_AA307490 [Artemisia annua]|uniref:KIB1-4 beta-propeller domain-containing protein n=1 Tax=Artemisia annua TaxID=35608 RepID=A0A2U1N4Y3_ARTAN|nr:hypothetical protein CTI12_AA307490 [Artemisia annua]